MQRLVNCQPYFKIHSPGTRSLVANQGAWTVPDLCRAYSWPSNLAGGGVIAIVELDGGWVESDMAAFFRGIGQPLPQITDVSVDGTQNKPNQHLGNPKDPDFEVTLDIQIAAAAYYAATGRPATIRVYWAQDIAPAIIRATADGCDVCSISWGSDEANWVEAGNKSGQNLIGQLEDAMRAATDAGMVVFAASGDNDSGDGGPAPANVDAPASCPHVIGCGGTTKTATTEVVWNNNPGKTDGHGTGGGYSTVFLVQSWQAGAPNGPGRMVPDVAANANLETGYWNFIHNAWTQTGGTSCVAPLYSGLFASFGRKLGWVTPKLWLNHLCFTDITQGDNGFFRARLGPDPCTGLGVPIGEKLAQLFSGPAVAAVVGPAVAPPAGPPVHLAAGPAAESAGIPAPASAGRVVGLSSVAVKNVSTLSSASKPSAPPFTYASLSNEWKLQAKTFTVYVVNLSNWNIIGVRVGQNGTPIRLPSPIGKTCSKTCDECQQDPAARAPLYGIECVADPFDLYLFLEQNGHFKVTTDPLHVVPSCESDGYGFCLQLADFGS